MADMTEQNKKLDIKKEPNNTNNITSQSFEKKNSVNNLNEYNNSFSLSLDLEIPVKKGNETEYYINQDKINPYQIKDHEFGACPSPFIKDDINLISSGSLGFPSKNLGFYDQINV